MLPVDIRLGSTSSNSSLAAIIITIANQNTYSDEDKPSSPNHGWRFRNGLLFPSHVQFSSPTSSFPETIVTYDVQIDQLWLIPNLSNNFQGDFKA